MKKRILVLFLTLSLLAGVLSPALPAAAADDPVLSGECGEEGDNLLWSFDPQSGTLRFTGSGAMADYEASADRPWNEYVGQVLHVELPAGLTHLGMASLIRCDKLTELTLPESLVSIGDQALSLTGPIEELRIPDSVVEVSAPLYSSGVKKVIVGKGLRELPAYFCAKCPDLTEVVLSEGVEQLGPRAFFTCPALKTVQLPESLRTIDAQAFCYDEALDSVRIPDNVTSIGAFAFGMCYALEDVRLPAKLQEVDDCAFMFAGLKKLELPDSVTKIGDSAFRSCYALAEIRIGTGLTEIADWAFADACVTELTVPANIRRIGTGAFFGCTQLEQAALPETLESIGEFAFYRSGLRSVTIPADVAALGTGAFAHCPALPAIAVAEGNAAYASADGVVLTSDGKTLVLYPAGRADKTYAVPDGVETIAASSMECAPLEGVVFPDSLKTIGADALLDCARLGSVTLPAGVTELGEHALGFLEDPEAEDYAPIEGFTISGCPGSAAETYAEENGFAFIGRPQPADDPFEDVAEGSYYYDAVLWAVANGVTTGTSSTRFSPDRDCTRAQVVTFLWRAAGSPAPKATACPFADVAPGAYYEQAVLWAVEQGVTTGLGSTRFGPGRSCTRAQVVTFLWRAAGSPAPKAADRPFADVDPGAYYGQAVLWAVEQGVTTGLSDTKFGPARTCTRGQIVTFLYRAQ